MPESVVRARRPPAVAGFFYPSEPVEVRETADALLARAQIRLDGVDPSVGSASSSGHPGALIVPHAGWRWSGDLSALGWQTLACGRGTITRVVVLGPTHRVAIRGVALPGCDRFATPLGDLRVPTEDVLRVTRDLDLPVTVNALTHASEHAIEVQAPFVQRVLGDVEFVPLNVGLADPAQVGDIIEALWDRPGTVIAVSTDLSHYLHADQARDRDAETLRRIVHLQRPVDPERACGASPLGGLLEVCARRGLTPRLLGSHNSGDISGDQDRVVGYAALIVEETNHDSSL